jgi:hypothetical protein
MAQLALPALIIGTGASVGGQLAAGGQKAAAAEFEQQQYAQQAQAAKTAALQDEAARRRDLTSNLETIQALRAGRGVGSGSPTAMAIYDSSIGRAEDEIASAKANYAAKADLASRASYLSGKKAASSLLAANLGALETVGSAAFKYNTPYMKGL